MFGPLLAIDSVPNLGKRKLVKVRSNLKRCHTSHSFARSPIVSTGLSNEALVWESPSVDRERSCSVMIDDVPALDNEIRNNSVKSSPPVVRVHLESVDFHLVGAGC